MGNKGLLHVTEVGWDKTAGLFSLGDWAALI